MPQRVGVTSRVVKHDISDSQSGNRVDGHELHRRILEVEASDGGGLEGVGVEKIGLGLAVAVTTLSVPPAGATAVNGVAACTSDCDGGSRDGDEGTGPLLVAESRGSLKDDLGKS